MFIAWKIDGCKIYIAETFWFWTDVESEAYKFETEERALEYLDPERVRLGTAGVTKCS